MITLQVIFIYLCLVVLERFVWKIKNIIPFKMAKVGIFGLAARVHVCKMWSNDFEILKSGGGGDIPYSCHSESVEDMLLDY